VPTEKHKTIDRRAGAAQGERPRSSPPEKRKASRNVAARVISGVGGRRSRATRIPRDCRIQLHLRYSYSDPELALATWIGCHMDAPTMIQRWQRLTASDHSRHQNPGRELIEHLHRRLKNCGRQGVRWAVWGRRQTLSKFWGGTPTPAALKHRPKIPAPKQYQTYIKNYNLTCIAFEVSNTRFDYMPN
jgi:hypothetical protein